MTANAKGLTIREQWLLLLVFMVVAAVAFYFLLLSPLLLANATLLDEQNQLQAELDQRRTWQRLDSKTIADLQEANKAHAALMDQFDAISSRYDLFLFLEQFSLEEDLSVSNVTFLDTNLSFDFVVKDYAHIGRVITGLEKEPNIYVNSASISPSGEGYSSRLHLGLDYGQGKNLGIKYYNRDIPFPTEP